MGAPPPSGDRTFGRVLAVAGVIGLLIVGIVMLTIIGGADDGGDDTVAATPTPSLDLSTPTPTPKPVKTPEPLTAAQQTELDDAVELVQSRDFEVLRERDWNPDATLRVLIGRSSSGGELAFFFSSDGSYLGNDDSDTSSRIRVVKSSGVTATLKYGIYAAGDAVEDPSGTPFQVTFTLTSGAVSADQELPVATERNPS